MTTTKVTTKEIKKWVSALRNGTYKQTQNALQDKKGYCCLGVACEILIPESKKMRFESGLLIGGEPQDQDNSPKWLLDVDNHVRAKTGMGLYEMNDDEKFTFNEIADVLELVYIHEALEN